PLVEASRAQLEQHRPPRSLPVRLLRSALMGWLFADAPRFRLAVGATRFYQRSGLQKLARASGILKLLRMDEMEAMLPPISRKSLIPGDERWPADHAEEPAGRAHLFNGCIMGTVFANVNRAAARVVARNGADVDVPVGQQCCGALQVHAGMMDEARKLARRNIDAFERLGDDPIIVTAAGCGAALKEYGHLLKDDPAYAERAARFSARVRDVNEYLAEREL